MTGNSVDPDRTAPIVWFGPYLFASILSLSVLLLAIICISRLQLFSRRHFLMHFFLASNLPPEIHINHVHVHVHNTILLCTFYLPPPPPPHSSCFWDREIMNILTFPSTQLWSWKSLLELQWLCFFGIKTAYAAASPAPPADADHMTGDGYM